MRSWVVRLHNFEEPCILLCTYVYMSLSINGILVLRRLTLWSCLESLRGEPPDFRDWWVRPTFLCNVEIERGIVQDARAVIIWLSSLRPSRAYQGMYTCSKYIIINPNMLVLFIWRIASHHFSKQFSITVFTYVHHFSNHCSKHFPSFSQSLSYHCSYWCTNYFVPSLSNYFQSLVSSLFQSIIVNINNKARPRAIMFSICPPASWISSA